MMRSTPWVDGCCGPMLRIISSVRERPRRDDLDVEPPPRTIQFSAAALKAARSSVSTGPHPATDGRQRPTGPAEAAAAGSRLAAPWPAPNANARARLGRPRTPSPHPLGGRAPALRTGASARPAPSAGRWSSTRCGDARQVREAAEEGPPPPPDDEILARALALASGTAAGLVRVINATGVVLHTGLGRAPLPGRGRGRRRAGRAGYVDLEVDRESGRAR